MNIVSTLPISRPHNNAQFSNVTPYQLRALVLDYLCHNCFTSTARTFARDSTIRQLDADGDEIMSSEKGLVEEDALRLPDDVLLMAELRKKIRTHILSGQIDDTSSLLNEHIPSVLSDTASFIAPVTTSNTRPDQVDYVASSTLDPTHLSLNLRIQAFVEASRTVPLDYLPPGSSAPQVVDSTMTPASSPASFTSSHFYEHSISEVSDAHQADLLLRAQKLYTLASRLKNPSDRAAYLEELANVGGLLAYKIPEKSPMSKYLSQTHREAVADQINVAILHRTGSPAVSHLELYTRYTSVLWGTMRELKVKPPPLACRPPGVHLPPSGESSLGTSTLKAAACSESDETVPGFSLRLFMDSKRQL